MARRAAWRWWAWSVAAAAPALGQGARRNPIAVADPDPLPRAPLWEWLVFDQTWIAVGVLAALGLVAFHVLGTRGRGRGAWWALGGAAVLAGAVVVASEFVATARTRMVDSARTLVGAVARADGPVIAGELAPDATLRAWLFADDLDKSAIVREVVSRMRGEFEVKSHAIVRVQSCLDGPETGRVQVKVRVVPRVAEFPHLSWWRLHYRREGDGSWRVTHIEPLVVALVQEPRGG